MDNKLEHLYPDFSSKIKTILEDLNHWCSVHMKGYTATMVEGFRSQARQEELYAQGRTKPGNIVTKKNGTTNPSNHQSCLAADIAFLHNGKLTWNVEREAWEYLQHLAHV